MEVSLEGSGKAPSEGVPLALGPDCLISMIPPLVVSLDSVFSGSAHPHRANG